MKNLLTLVLLIIIGGVGYWMSQKGTDEGYGDMSILATIPADTAVFSGQLRPFPMKVYLESLKGSYQDDMLAEFMGDTKAEMFVLNFYDQYISLINDPDALLAGFGMSDSLQGYFYTLGMLPVMKWQIANPEAMNAQLDLAAAESDVIMELGTIGGVEVRRYLLDDEISLLVSYQAGWMTMTLDVIQADPSLLPMALGVTPIEHSMASTNLIGELIEKHGFLPDSLTFVNHESIVNAITGKDQSILASQIDKIVMAQGGDMADARTATCQAEAAAIASNWPKTVMGITQMSITPNRSEYTVKSVIESNNSVMMAALASLQGFIPTGMDALDGRVFSMALGLNTAKLSGSVSDIWQQLTQPQASCEFINTLQVSLQEANPAMMTMGAGMADGAMGVALNLFDFQMNEQGELNKLDAGISVSTPNPMTLINLLKSMEPRFSSLAVTADGTPTDISDIIGLPSFLPLSVMLAVKGEHLVVYSGDKGQAWADDLAKQTLVSNGVMSASADYQMLYEPLAIAMQMSGEPIPADLEMLQHQPMQVAFDIIVEPQGIVFNTHMLMEPNAN
ncbi:hypothetical protein [Shewanella sp. NIFS-20-20]|uniref:hypothetical protein n=1 Tax=Shewanella sp. NIFS-20-20 TaxID=2853806 RepID=UPI001C448BB6|nr:hypothetical protein [Shewanella sp. NIFS-20-20]MBV7315860.1 hypothetical protein [Shewanella sp. NIFS-20-20]